MENASETEALARRWSKFGWSSSSQAASMAGSGAGVECVGVGEERIGKRLAPFFFSFV